MESRTNQPAWVTSHECPTASGRHAANGRELEAVLLQHRDRIFRFVRSRGVSIEDAEDLTQETLIRGYRSFWQFEGGSLGTWLCTIARNATLDHWRRKKLATVPLENGVCECSWEGDPALHLLGTDQAVELSGLLESLRPDQRQMLYLRYVDQRSLQEMAEVLHCSPGAVGQRIFRAVTALRRLLAANRHHSA